MQVVAKFESTGNARKRLADLTTEITRLKEEAKGVCVEALKETCEDVFRTYPEIERFAWVQYGGEYDDEGAYPGINDVLVNEEVENSGYRRSLQSESSCSHAIHTKINELGSDVLIEALGGYHMVIVTRDAIAVDHWNY